MCWREQSCGIWRPGQLTSVRDTTIYSWYSLQRPTMLVLNCMSLLYSANYFTTIQSKLFINILTSIERNWIKCNKIIYSLLQAALIISRRRRFDFYRHVIRLLTIRFVGHRYRDYKLQMVPSTLSMLVQWSTDRMTSACFSRSTACINDNYIASIFQITISISNLLLLLILSRNVAICNCLNTLEDCPWFRW